MSEFLKADVLAYLGTHKEEFQKRYALTRLGIFGSVASDRYSNTSDIDVVYETLVKDLTFSQSLELEQTLKMAFHREIDLVNIVYMNPLIKRKALNEIIYV